MLKNKAVLITSIFLLFFFMLIAFIYYRLYVSFNFVDEYNNIVPAYFMLKGKLLYTDIFFNRQMLPAYISYIIQLLLHPDSLYQLIMYHRLFVLAFSVGMDLLLIARFKKPAIAFVLIYELTKYYLFGFLFQAEALIVYPLIYLFGLVYERFKTATVYRIEYILAAICTWFVVFMREPYIPLALFLYFSILVTKKIEKIHIISIILFSILSLITIITVDIKEYIFQMVTVNSKITIPDQARGGFMMELLKSFGYPIYIFITGHWNLFHGFLIVLSISLLSLIAVLIRSKKLILVGFIFIVLGLAAVRTIEPGTELYAGYRMLTWYSLVIFIIFSILFSDKLFKIRKSLAYFVIGIISIFGAYLTFNPWSFIWKDIDRKDEFAMNYSRHFTAGEVVRLLSDSDDRLFIDGYDSLIYWQAGIPSSYKYTFFYPPVENYPLYRDLRIQMFKKYPPDFYYKECITKNNFRLPDFAVSSYREFIFDKTGTCLYIKRAKLEKVNDEQLAKVKAYGYELRLD
ncbi:MAG TPA: hypothetical protein VK338_05800 [Candidatus Nitrosocosmicus sp.]|nr:hypothetical protein [Candidatus Nitrosocosmicus sp.]